MRIDRTKELYKSPPYIDQILPQNRADFQSSLSPQSSNAIKPQKSTSSGLPRPAEPPTNQSRNSRRRPSTAAASFCPCSLVNSENPSRRAATSAVASTSKPESATPDNHRGHCELPSLSSATSSSRAWLGAGTVLRQATFEHSSGTPSAFVQARTAAAAAVREKLIAESEPGDNQLVVDPSRLDATCLYIAVNVKFQSLRCELYRSSNGYSRGYRTYPLGSLLIIVSRKTWVKGPSGPSAGRPSLVTWYISLARAKADEKAIPGGLVVLLTPPNLSFQVKRLASDTRLSIHMLCFVIIEKKESFRDVNPKNLKLNSGNASKYIPQALFLCSRYIVFSTAMAFGLVNGVPVFLAKPQTYMNLSGQFIGPLAAYYKLPLNRVLVVHDDMDLPCGVLRLNSLGNHGSHNGLKSVIHHFRGNKEFPRLRIGIGRPAGQMDPKAFLLQKFNASARERIDGALVEGVDALEQLLSKGLTEASRYFNRDQKYKHIRLQTMPV
ncbi:peptidyl-tRNA hydrolase family protein [Striga asiatica]|uniref:Peptidyl-tRNA hydrolase family protein n=1 Tax=Striga asiatica TaxID=4170 RepID=A0A5A7R083_STRAF|nr:peptidyl-tRNA hydrolase family protein [Striga asiatica]